MSKLNAEDRWLIALDIDGTLVHDDGYLSPAVVKEVQRVRDLGHLVVVATGRSAANAFPVIREIGILDGHALDDRADRNLVDAPGVDRQVERQGHVEGVVPVQLGRAHLLERANKPGAGGREVAFHGGRITQEGPMARGEAGLR